MPLYSDLGLYYSPHLATPSYYSSPFLGASARSSAALGLGLLPVPRLLPSRVSPGYAPLLPSIPEAGYSAARRAVPSLDRAASPRAPRFLPPKPLRIDTADIDVSAARFGRRDPPDRPDGGEPARQPTIKRGRTVVRLHTKKLKENPALDARRRLTPGEKLVQKFLIVDKAEEAAKAARRQRLEEAEQRERAAEMARLQAMAAKKAAADADAGAGADPPEGQFAQEPGAAPPVQHFPTIQGLTENAALDLLLSATDDDDEAKAGDSSGTVKKRKVKEKEGTVKAAKKKTKKKDALGNSASEDSPATGDEMLEKSTLQRRNTVRFRRNSQDVEGFPEIESVPGSRRTSFDMSPSSRRSSFDQSPSSRRSSLDSTGDETPMASEKKSTVKRKKGAKHKIVADVSVDNNSSTEPRSPKFVVDEVKVEHSPASPRGQPKKFRYEVIVEDVEEESAPGRRGKPGRENKAEAASKKKKAAADKPLADRQGKAEPKSSKVQEEAAGPKADVKESAQKSFQKSRPKQVEETKSHVATSKTEENAGKIGTQKSKENTCQDVTPTSVTPEKKDVHKILKTTKNEVQGENIDKDKGKHFPVKDRKLSAEIPKLDAKNIQKGIYAAGKSKPATVTAVVPKVEEAKLGKEITEKFKTSKHQPDPTPPPTPTIQKSDSGINFWAFLNGSDEEKEVGKPLFSKQEPLIQPEPDKKEKTKAVKTKPQLHLNIQNKFTPAEKIPETAEVESQPTLFGKKFNNISKTNEDKKVKRAVKPGDITKDSTKSFGVQKETQSSPPKMSLEKDSVVSTPKVEEVDLPAKAVTTIRNGDTSKQTQKDGLSTKSPDEKVPKGEALTKDHSKTPGTPNTAGNCGIEGKNQTEVISPLPETKVETPKTKDGPLKHDESKTKESGKELTTTAFPKEPATPEKRAVPKWKAFGKQPQSTLESSKDEMWSPKTPVTPEPKNSDGKLKTQISQMIPETPKTNGESPRVPSPTLETRSNENKPPTTAVGGFSKTPEDNKKEKSPLGSQQKESSVGEEPLKKNLLKTRDNKESKTSSKVTTLEEGSKPVPKWKVKGDKDTQPKKTPLGKIQQSSSDNSISAQKPEEVKTATRSEPATPLAEKSLFDSQKTPAPVELTDKLPKTEPKASTDAEKPPKKPLAKTKAAAKEDATKDSEPSRQLNTDQKSVLPPTTNEINEKEPKHEEAADKTKDKVAPGKPKLTEQKSKDEEKDVRTPFGKKITLPDEKALDKKGEGKITPGPKKGLNLTAQMSLAEAKSEGRAEEKSGGAGGKKSEPTTLAKKKVKPTGQKSQDEEKSEVLTAVKKVPENKEEGASPVKKTENMSKQKSEETEKGKKDCLGSDKKALKTAAQKSKEGDEREPTSPVKKVKKVAAQKSKEEDTQTPLSAAKKGGKLAAQKSKEDTSEPSSPATKAPKLAAEKSKDEEKAEPSPPTKIVAKSEEEDKRDSAAPARRGAKAAARRSRQDAGEDSAKAAAAGRATPKGASKAKEAAPSPQAPPAPAPARAPASGSEADGENSSSSSEDEDGDEDGGATPRASGSSCSSSDSGFDSRPSSVPVPSTASEASSSPSPSLASSQLLDPYSEDAGLLPRAATGRSTPPACSLPRFRKYTVDDFQFLKLLGKGSFGKVMLAELRGTDRHYAVKCLKKDVVLEDDDVECTLIERKVLSLGSKHPYLCHLFCTFQTESHLLFVMEYLNGGDLMFHIQQSGRFAEPRARFYAAEIVCGLKFLHKKGIVYRDLKLDNILLDYEGHVRIADFGMCKLQIFLDRTADTFCGTPDYMAPEIIKGLKYNQCVDWWSFGVLVFEMLVGVSPFTGCDEDELFWSICNEQPQYPRFLSREAHSLLTSLLEKDASKRLGTQGSPKGDVPDHVFFRSVDWGELERRELEPPFRPRVKHPLDVQYFDKAFTAERAELTPVDASILQSMDQAQFQGFSYTNPNATD
ncbi:hypothetical protein R5R35_010944 [Gryllus longicercus]|uniref:Uncharacterized protein n=1 Tax=Gryllus longicercus TaxID=2509291 RepID=A0AAN9VMJ8_9ORTH